MEHLHRLAFRYICIGGSIPRAVFCAPGCQPRHHGAPGIGRGLHRRESFGTLDIKALPFSSSPVGRGEGYTSIKHTLVGLRDYAILAVALYTGRRAHELVGLRWQDVRIAGRKDTRVTLTFHCKGHKVMHDKLDVEASAVLEYLHAQYGKNLLRLVPGTPLWVFYSRVNKG